MRISKTPNGVEFVGGEGCAVAVLVAFTVTFLVGVISLLSYLRMLVIWGVQP